MYYVLLYSYQYAFFFFTDSNNSTPAASSTDRSILDLANMREAFARFPLSMAIYFLNSGIIIDEIGKKNTADKKICLKWYIFDKERLAQPPPAPFFLSGNLVYMYYCAQPAHCQHNKQRTRQQTTNHRTTVKQQRTTA